MKLNFIPRGFRAAAKALAGLVFVPSAAFAADRWWDGGAVDIGTNGNSASAGGAGTWNTTTLNWDAGAVPHVAWNNAGNDTARFAGAGAAVTVATPVTVGALTFTHTGTYTFSGSSISMANGGILTGVGNTTIAIPNLALAPGNTTFILANSTNPTAGFSNGNQLTVTGLTGTANLAVNSGNLITIGNASNYTGSTTINAGGALRIDNASMATIGGGGRDITVATDGSIVRSAGSVNNAFLNRLAENSNTFTIYMGNGSNSNNLDFSSSTGANLPNAVLSFYDSVGTQGFTYTGTITPGSNGYRLGGQRAGNYFNLPNANSLTGANDLLVHAGRVRLLAANNFSGTTTVDSTNGGTLYLTDNLNIQNSAIDTSGLGKIDVSGAKGPAGGNVTNPVTAPVIGGLIGSRNLSDVFNASYTTTGTTGVTSLTLNPGTGKDLTYSGIISDGATGMTLTKTGVGIQRLSGANTYTGLTTVSVGTLVAGSNAALGTTAGGTTVNSGAALVLANGVTITGETATISGSGVNFTGALRTATAANGSWAGPVILGDANARVGASAATTLTISGAIQDGAGTSLFVTGESGTGTVVVSGANTYSGSTNIIRGTLQIGATNSLPTGTELDVDNSSASENATFDLNGFNQTIGALQRTNAGGGTGGSFVTNSASGPNTLTVNQAVNTTYNGVVQGNLALTKSGVGTLTLSGANAYTGITTVNAGILAISNNNALGGTTPATQYTTIPGNTTNSGRVELSGGITTGETFRLNARQAGTIDAPHISNVSGNNTINGQLQGRTGGSDMNVESVSGTLTLAGGITQTEGTGNRVWKLMGAGNGDVSGVISNGTATTLEIRKMGAGTWTLSNSNTHTGATLVNEGVLQLGHVSALSNTSGVTMANGTTLRPTIANVTVGAPITTTGAVTIGAPTTALGTQAWNEFILNGAIGGTGDVTFNNTNNANQVFTVTLGAAGTYSGNTLIQNTAGTNGQITLKLGATNALPTTTVVTIDGNNGSGTGRSAELNMNGFSQTLAGLSSITGRTSRVQRVVNPDNAAAATLTIDGTGTSTFSGFLGSNNSNFSLNPSAANAANGNNFQLVKNGTGTFILNPIPFSATSGATTVNWSGNTYTGGTILNDGILRANQTTAFGAAGASVTLNGGTLQFNGGSTDADHSYNLVVAGNTNIETLTNRKDFVGSITGAGTLTVIGSQGLRMETDMSGFTGTLIKNSTNELHLMIDNATFGTNATSSGSSAASFQLNAGKTFLLNNSQAGTAYMGALSGTGGTIFSKFNRIGDVVLEVGAMGFNTTYAGLISDGDGTAPVGSNITSFLKVGSGAQTLTGANTYSGGTTVNGGTLFINNTTGSGTGSGPVIVNAGGTLGGNGTITTTGLTVNAGGTLAPGNSPENLTVNGPVVLSAGSLFGVEVNVGGVTAVGNGTTGTDLLTVNGTIDLTGALLTGTYGGGPGNVFLGNLNADNMTWIVNNDLVDSITGTFANTTASPGLSGLFGTPAYFGSVGGQPVAVFYNSQFGVTNAGGLSGGNDLLLIAIPEPSRALLALLALVPLAVRRRR